MWLPEDLFISASIIFWSVGLFVYWAARALLVLSAPMEEVDQVLEADLWWGRRVLMALRILFTPAMPTMSI